MCAMMITRGRHWRARGRWVFDCLRRFHATLLAKRRASTKWSLALLAVLVCLGCPSVEQTIPNGSQASHCHFSHINTVSLLSPSTNKSNPSFWLLSKAKGLVTSVFMGAFYFNYVIRHCYFRLREHRNEDDYLTFGWSLFFLVGSSLPWWIHALALSSGGAARQTRAWSRSYSQNYGFRVYLNSSARLSIYL